MRSRRTQVLIALAIAISVAVGAALLIDHHYYGPTPFDRATWIASATLSSEPSPRLRMADGLVAQRTLIGKTRTEVESMLGPVTATQKFRDYAMVYWLGNERGFISVDSEWLALTLEGDRVTQVRIVRD